MVFVVLLLQVSEELPVKPVDLLDVAEDGLQLELSEHVWVFAALTDVTLRRTVKQNSSVCGQQGELKASPSDAS